MSSRGSSPRVWGIRHDHRERMPKTRFIPTRVGNTPSGRQEWQPCSVHPHACGEYRRAVTCSVVTSGSSPRVWGIRHAAKPCRRTARFIPTRVGNTSVTAVCPLLITVHPHACGEYVTRVPGFREEDGSSPRVWGIHSSPRLPGLNARFIPTRVGNTHFRGRKYRPSAVHPHACGEYLPCPAGTPLRCGSSPRVWGIRRPSRRRCPATRFIPTRVGNTAGQGRAGLGRA